VYRDHPPGTVTVGNYSPDADKDLALTTPAGKTIIDILPKPDLYRTVADWIDATEHGAANSKETVETFPNESAGPIHARCFMAMPGERLPGDWGCILDFHGVPVMLDLMIPRRTKDIRTLQNSMRDMIRAARPVSK